MRLPDFDPTWSPELKKIYDYDIREMFGLNGRNIAPEVRSRYMNRWRAITSRIEAQVSPGSRILDIAAAQGNFSLHLAERGYEVVWNDLRSELKPYVMAKSEGGSVSFLEGNIYDLSADLERQFDAVIATEIIEHVAHPDQLLVHIALVLKSGGLAYLTTPNGLYFRNRLPKFSEHANPAEFEAVQFQPDGDGHIFLIHPDEMRELADRAGLEVRELLLITNPVTGGQMKSRYIHRVVPEEMIRQAEDLSRRLPMRLQERFMTIMLCVLEKR